MRSTRHALVAMAAVSLLAAGCGDNSSTSKGGGGTEAGFTPP